MHKDLSFVLTSPITYHIWILKGYSKEPIGEATPMSSQITCQSQCTLVGITCILVGTHRNRLDETTKHMFKPVYRRTSITCASFSYLAAEILCCGYPWESSHETTPMSTQNTFINQCTREHTLTVLAIFVITV